MQTWTRRAALTGASAAIAAVGGAANAQTQTPDDTFSALLGAYVAAHADGVNRVAYRRWRANRADMQRLDAVVAAYADLAPARMARAAAIAYWANLYNALTLKVVLGRYPVDSIRDIRSEGVPFDPQGYLGPWRTKLVSVEGRRLSLDDIEHRTLRPLARDPRIHYAVNCASIGCPNLQPAAWRASTLDAELDRAARAFINHPRAASVSADGALRVSSIYEWFKEDFGGNDAGVIAHLRRFADADLAQRLTTASRIGGHHYDWTLNDAA